MSKGGGGFSKHPLLPRWQSLATCESAFLVVAPRLWNTLPGEIGQEHPSLPPPPPPPPQPHTDFWKLSKIEVFRCPFSDWPFTCWFYYHFTTPVFGLHTASSGISCAAFKKLFYCFMTTLCAIFISQRWTINKNKWIKMRGWLPQLQLFIRQTKE